MKKLESRLQVLENAPRAPDGRLPRPLPIVLSDDAPQAEIDALRARGLEAYRFSEAVEVFAP